MKQTICMLTALSALVLLGRAAPAQEVYADPIGEYGAPVGGPMVYGGDVGNAPIGGPMVYGGDVGNAPIGGPMIYGGDVGNAPIGGPMVGGGDVGNAPIGDDTLY